MNRILSLLVLLLFTPAALADEQSWPNHGLTLFLPDGWTVIDETEEDGGLAVLLVPTTERSVRVSVRLNPVPEGVTAIELRDMGLERARSLGVAEAIEAIEDRIGREPAVGIRAELPLPAGRTLLEQLVQVVDGRRVVVESRAPAAVFPAFDEHFRQIRSSLVLESPQGEESVEDRMRAVAARVVEDLPWASSWEEAAERSRAEGRPILVRVFMYAGFSLGLADAVAPFADPDVARLVRDHYVPFILGKGTPVPFEDPDLYGIGPMGFGSGFMIAAPDGQILREAVVDLESFLAGGLDLEPWAGLREPAATVAEAMVRMDYERASELMEEPGDAAAFHSLARLELARRDASAARAALVRARELAAQEGDRGLRFELVLDGHVLALRAGEEAAFGSDLARTELARCIEEIPDHPRAGEARMRLAETALALGLREEAIERLENLALDRQSDRWGWYAASFLRTSTLEGRERVRASWPGAAWLSSLRPVDPAPLAPEDLDRARESALNWLVEHQRADGSWPVPSEAGAPEGERPNAFVIAATSIATRALLPYSDRADVQASVRAGLAFLSRDAAKPREEPSRPAFMDYSCWSHPLEVRLVAALVREGLVDPGRPDAIYERAMAGLARLQKDDGGWGYYLTGDLSVENAPPTPSMSFTTAGVLVALLDAREAGLEVSDSLIDGAVRQLESARNGDGTFEYWLTGAPRPGAAVGAAGRAPICTLALVRAGAREPAELSPALALFSEHRAAQAAEAGKLLMHCGPGGLGSHYPFYNYLGAAESLAHLDSSERGRRRLELLEVLLAARYEDGSFLDNPLIGRATATGLALLALDSAGD